MVNDTDKNLQAAIADKEDVIKECKRQLFEVKTYIKLSVEQMEMLIAKIQTDLEEVIGKHKTQKIAITKSQHLF